MILTNKHVVTAFIVTPVLAMLGYFIADLLVKEEPHIAIEGSSYALVAKSNCRYTSGECDLVNAAFKTKLIVESTDQGDQLTLQSNYPLDGVKIGFSNSEKSTSVIPTSMSLNDETQQRWSVELPQDTNEHTKLMISMQANGAYYFAESQMAFSAYETAVGKNFKTNGGL